MIATNNNNVDQNESSQIESAQENERQTDTGKKRIHCLVIHPVLPTSNSIK
jgi:hypothetical protein